MKTIESLWCFFWVPFFIIMSLINCVSANAFERDPHWYMAEAIYYEARGEPLEGQYAVAHVIMNRVQSKRYPSSVYEVLYQRRQFSYTFDGSLSKPIDYDSLEWYNALRIAGNVLTGHHKDNTNGANHYQNVNWATDGWWRFGMVQTIRVGDHWFYRGK